MPTALVQPAHPLPADSSPVRFEFDIHPVFRLPAAVFGVTESTAHVDVDEHLLCARFGPWSMDVPRHAIVDAEVTGPYPVRKVIGPAHLSLRDRGLTFATNPGPGVCLRFRRPRRGMDALGLLRHPGLTVTVTDPAALVELLST